MIFQVGYFETKPTSLQKKKKYFGSSRTATTVVEPAVLLESMAMTAKLLRSNPDFSSLWNYRREIISHWCPNHSVEGKFEGDNFESIRDTELALSADGLRRNPKSCEWMLSI